MALTTQQILDAIAPQFVGNPLAAVLVEVADERTAPASASGWSAQRRNHAVALRAAHLLVMSTDEAFSLGGGGGVINPLGHVNTTVITSPAESGPVVATLLSFVSFALSLLPFVPYSPTYHSIVLNPLPNGFPGRDTRHDASITGKEKSLPVTFQ